MWCFKFKIGKNTWIKRNGKPKTYGPSQCFFENTRWLVNLLFLEYRRTLSSDKCNLFFLVSIRFGSRYPPWHLLPRDPYYCFPECAARSLLSFWSLFSFTWPCHFFNLNQLAMDVRHVRMQTDVLQEAVRQVKLQLRYPFQLWFDLSALIRFTRFLSFFQAPEESTTLGYYEQYWQGNGWKTDDAGNVYVGDDNAKLLLIQQGTYCPVSICKGWFGIW